MSLTPEERVRIRHHLGYLNVGPVYTFVLGSPAGIESNFMIEGAMDRVLPAAVPLLRTLLIRLDATEQQMFDDQENLAVSSIGDITIDPKEQTKLRKQYQYWQGRAANLLGVTVGPYSKVAEDGGATANGTVING